MAGTKKGDTVEWTTSQGKTTGTVNKKLTKPRISSTLEIKMSNPRR